MNEKQFSPKELSKLFGVTTQTLQDWEKCGKIRAIRTPGGHRRYIHNIPNLERPGQESRRNFIYARVSSSKQKEDLQRQIALLQHEYPNFEVIQDIGSGINFKRKGLLTLLENVFGGNVSTIVVAHRDRLTRFGFDMFQYIFDRFKVSLKILSNDDIKEPIQELATDLLSIVTVFTTRYYGSRSYKILSKDKILPKRTTSKTLQQMPRRVKILLQQSNKHLERKRGERFVDSSSSSSTSHAK